MDNARDELSLGTHDPLSPEWREAYLSLLNVDVEYPGRVARLKEAVDAVTDALAPKAQDEEAEEEEEAAAAAEDLLATDDDIREKVDAVVGALAGLAPYAQLARFEDAERAALEEVDVPQVQLVVHADRTLKGRRARGESGEVRKALRRLRIGGQRAQLVNLLAVGVI